MVYICVYTHSPGPYFRNILATLCLANLGMHTMKMVGKDGVRAISLISLRQRLQLDCPSADMIILKGTHNIQVKGARDCGWYHTLLLALHE